MEMMDSAFDFSFVWSAFGLLAQLAVFGICIYYVVTKPAADSILMVVGSFIHFLTTVFNTIGIMILSRTHGVDFFSNRLLFNVVGALGMIGTICFTTGLIILIINQVNRHKKAKNSRQV